MTCDINLTCDKDFFTVGGRAGLHEANQFFFVCWSLHQAACRVVKEAVVSLVCQTASPRELYRVFVTIVGVVGLVVAC